MNVWVILFEMLVFAVLFTMLVFFSYRDEQKYSIGSIHNYPPDIQEEYFKTHPRVDVSYKSKKVILTKMFGILFFIVIIYACARIAGATTFKQGFLLGFGLMVWIGIYDTFFLDWVLFANLPQARLEGTEHMDEAYHQKWFHVKGMLWPGILFAVIVGLATGTLVTFIH